MAIDYFDQKLALNDLTGNVLANAVAQVYAIEDTTYSTPLEITDLSGVPLDQLRSSPTGIYPAFIVPSGETQVVARSGGVVTPLTSLLGTLLLMFPDPSSASDGLILAVSEGAYVLALGGGGGGDGDGSARSVFYDAAADVWPPRPPVTGPVTFYSTTDASAIRHPDMAVGDMWVQHPDALEEP